MSITYGVIPARSGSKGVKNKNKRLLADKPLFWYTCKTALESSLDKVFLNTNDDEIIDYVLKEFKEIIIPFKRPEALASDSSTAMDVVLHLLSHLDNDLPNSICWLQPTSPLRTVQNINECLSLIGDYEAVVSVVDVGAHHPHKMKRIENGFLVPLSLQEHTDNSNRQELPPAYVCNGAIFLTKTSCLIQKKTFYGEKCIPYIMPHNVSLNIDDEYDFEIAEFLLKRQLGQ